MQKCRCGLLAPQAKESVDWPVHLSKQKVKIAKSCRNSLKSSDSYAIVVCKSRLYLKRMLRKLASFWK